MYIVNMCMQLKIYINRTTERKLYILFAEIKTELENYIIRIVRSIKIISNHTLKHAMLGWIYYVFDIAISLGIVQWLVRRL
jgi:hypothetical protein